MALEGKVMAVVQVGVMVGVMALAVEEEVEEVEVGRA